MNDLVNSAFIDHAFPNKSKATRIFTKKQELTVDTIVNTVWISTFLALILTVPSLLIFIGIYFVSGNILVGAVIGFGLHFVGLAYSEKISKGLLQSMS